MTAQLPISFNDSAGYELFMGRWSRAAGDLFLRWLSPPLHGHWLDVGCGTGIFTEQVIEMCSPAKILGIDPAEAQIERARTGPAARVARFQIADAQALPFPDTSFDIVVSALAINFIPDARRALFEMRRTARAGGIVACYVWDFGAELSPSWPLRHGMRQLGIESGCVPGVEVSGISALRSLFESSGLTRIIATRLDVTASFSDFDEFWQAQTPTYSPTTRLIAAMTERDRSKLMDLVRSTLPYVPSGRIKYDARANAIVGYVAE